MDTSIIDELIFRNEFNMTHVSENYRDAQMAFDTFAAVEREISKEIQAIEAQCTLNDALRSLSLDEDQPIREETQPLREETNDESSRMENAYNALLAWKLNLYREKLALIKKMKVELKDRVYAYLGVKL